MRHSFTILSAALALLPVAAYGTGETGAQFLKIGVGARACAMGEAFTGVADDVTALYWNPAGLTRAGNIEVLAMQNFWLLDMSYQYAAGACKTPLGRIGVSGAYSSSGTIPKYENFRKVGEYTAYDAAVTLGYARSFLGLSAGATGKLIQQKIEEENALGFGFDAGLLYYLPVPIVDIGFGVAVQNIGPGIKFIEKTDPLPLNVEAGASVGLGPALVAVDVSKPTDAGLRFNVGGEFTVLNVLALRAGYNTANSLSVGGGVTWQMVSVDYAFVPYKDIDAPPRMAAGVGSSRAPTHPQTVQGADIGKHTLSPHAAIH